MCHIPFKKTNCTRFTLIYGRKINKAVGAPKNLNADHVSGLERISSGPSESLTTDRDGSGIIWSGRSESLTTDREDSQGIGGSCPRPDL